jgi:hypothetical protein
MPQDDKPKPGTVAEMRKRFEKGSAAQSPAKYEVTQKDSVVRSSVASYNLALRGAQVKAQRRATLHAQNPKAQADEQFELLTFTEEFEDYPWHLGALRRFRLDVCALTLVVPLAASRCVCRRRGRVLDAGPRPGARHGR